MRGQLDAIGLLPGHCVDGTDPRNGIGGRSRDVDVDGGLGLLVAGILRRNKHGPSALGGSIVNKLALDDHLANLRASFDVWKHAVDRVRVGRGGNEGHSTHRARNRRKAEESRCYPNCRLFRHRPSPSTLYPTLYAGRAGRIPSIGGLDARASEKVPSFVCHPEGLRTEPRWKVA